MFLDGAFLSKWDAFIVSVACAASILTSFQASFHNYQLSSFILGYIFDLCFLVDMFWKTHTAYLQGGFWVIFPKEMLYRYLSSNEFKFDAIANFPYDLLVFLAYINVINVDVLAMLTIVRLPKLLRTARVSIYFGRAEQKLRAGFLIQIVKFVTVLGFLQINNRLSNHYSRASLHLVLFGMSIWA
jgi:hypothetical protein